MRSRQTKNRIALGIFINKTGTIVYLYTRYSQDSQEYRRILGKKKCGNYIKKGYSYNIYDIIAS